MRGNPINISFADNALWFRWAANFSRLSSSVYKASVITRVLKERQTFMLLRGDIGGRGGTNHLSSSGMSLLLWDAKEWERGFLKTE